MTTPHLFRSRNRFKRGFKLLLLVVAAVTALYLLLLFSTLMHNRAKTNQELFDTAYKNAYSLVSFVDHEGFRNRIFGDAPVIEKIDYFRSASDSQIHGQQIISPHDSFIGPLNPFIPGTPMHEFVEQIRLFTQVSFDIEMLLFHTPANAYYIGSENGGQSSIIAKGEAAAANALHISESELARLLAGNDLALTESQRGSGQYDQIVFSIDIGNEITLLLRARWNVLKATLMKSNYGRQFSPVAVALLHEDKGIYWLASPAGCTTQDNFLDLGKTAWATAPQLFDAESGSEKLVVLNYELDAGYKFRHVVAIEQSEYVKMNRSNVALMAALALLWIVACVAIGVILYHEWYTPISRMLAQMPPETGGEAAQQEQERDEYVLISSGIENMRREIDSHQLALTRHREALRRVVLARLLQSPTAVLTEQAATQHSLSTLLQRYTLIVFWPDHAASDRLPDHQSDGLSHAVEALLRTQLAPDEEAILLPQAHQAVLLIASSTRRDEEILPLLIPCLPLIGEAYHSAMRAYASGFVSDPSLHSAYNRALLTPAVLYPPEMEEQSAAANATKSRARMGHTMTLYACLDAHDYDAALPALDQILATIFEDSIPLPLRFSLLSGLSGDLYCRILESSKGAKDLLDGMPMQYPNGEIAGREDFLARWSALFDSLRHVQEQDKPLSPLYAQIVEYVEAHYQESDLSLTRLADAFGVGTATISREFKKNADTGFLEHLHKRRVAAAKELIRTTDTPLKDIALLVGYDNALTMTRAFKKYEGMTPGAFRES